MTKAFEAFRAELDELFQNGFKVNPNTCPRCNGRGYTKREAPELVRHVTVRLGSGCTKCKGRGVISD